MKYLIRKIALLMVALSLLLLITPATANPIPTTPWAQERDSIIGWVLYCFSYPGADYVVYYPDIEEVVGTDELGRFQDMISNARIYARTRLSSFTSSGFH